MCIRDSVGPSCMRGACPGSTRSPAPGGRPGSLPQLEGSNTRMKTSVGIEALAVALPRRTLHLEDLARARGVAPAKYIAGLGVREMAVTDPGEDTVALAATAVRRLIEPREVDPGSIGMLSVGTE